MDVLDNQQYMKETMDQIIQDQIGFELDSSQYKSLTAYFQVQSEDKAESEASFIY